jgi:hypothetical protein
MCGAVMACTMLRYQLKDQITEGWEIEEDCWREQQTACHHVPLIQQRGILLHALHLRGGGGHVVAASPIPLRIMSSTHRLSAAGSHTQVYNL